MISRSVLISARCRAEAAVSYLPSDTCRVEIYRRQRNSCWFRYTPASALADLPARRWPSPDRPEHKRRSQCTRWIDVKLRDFIERRAAIVIGAALCRMDTIHRAHIHTGGILGPDTGFGDDVGHGSPP